MLIGFLAHLLMPGNDPGGLVVTSLLGIVGSFIGAFLGSYLQVGMTWFASFVMSVVAATLLVGIYRLVIKSATPTS
jgi:uncharacterized membrane protein YeaQ/YmgE (transglycosylase-associated protein family)